MREGEINNSRTRDRIDVGVLPMILFLMSQFHTKSRTKYTQVNSFNSQT